MPGRGPEGRTRRELSRGFLAWNTGMSYVHRRGPGSPKCTCMRLLLLSGRTWLGSWDAHPTGMVGCLTACLVRAALLQLAPSVLLAQSCLGLGGEEGTTVMPTLQMFKSQSCVYSAFDTPGREDCSANVARLSNADDSDDRPARRNLLAIFSASRLWLMPR